MEPVEARLRSEILAGRAAPGSKLRLAELAARLEVSTGVVREALIRLAAGGLVDAEPQLGFRVASVSDSDLRDLIEARLVIECSAFESAIEHGDVEWEGRVISAYHHLSRVEHSADAGRTGDAWVASHRSFHEALISGCPNRRLISVSMSLRDAAELYRASSVGGMTPADAEQRDQEHLALRDAAIDRDLENGPALLRDHIRMTARYFNLSL